MSAMRITLVTFVTLLFTAGVASAQYGYSVQGPAPAGMGRPQPITSSYSPATPPPTFDPNMGMGTASYGGPAYSGQQNYPGQPVMASPVNGSMLGYGQLDIDYLRTTYADKNLKASDGLGISLKTPVFNFLYLHFGVDFSSGTDSTFSAKNYDFSTITLGGGGHFAITDRFHLTGEIGFLYANLSATRSNLSFSNGAVYIKPGVRFAATDDIELDGNITATSADKYDSFVFDLGGYYKIFAQMDLGLNVGFGDQSTTYRAGVRFRW